MRHHAHMNKDVHVRPDVQDGAGGKSVLVVVLVVVVVVVEVSVVPIVMVFVLDVVVLYMLA